MNKEKLFPILPNLLTTAGLILGLASIISSIDVINIENYQLFNVDLVFEKFWWSSALIGIAVIIDMFDGKVARALKTESNFGASYDSLSDLISFGVAPAVLIYIWQLAEYGKIGLIVIFFYVVCVALRLARFNIESRNEEMYKFTGLPSPMAAGLLFAPILLFSDSHIVPGDKVGMYYLFAVPFIGLIMVSQISYLKFPRLSKFGRFFNMLLVAAIIIASVVTNLAIVIVTVTYVYFLLGIFLCLFRIVKNKITVGEEAEIFNR